MDAFLHKQKKARGTLLPGFAQDLVGIAQAVQSHVLLTPLPRVSTDAGVASSLPFCCSLRLSVAVHQGLPAGELLIDGGEGF